MPTVLSTKVLTPAQQELFINSGLGLVQYDAIEVRPKKFSIVHDFDYLIFTSQNAVKSYTIFENLEKCRNKGVFCVGEKTKSLLESFGFSIMENAKNAHELAKTIVEKYQNSSFLYVCGNLRRADLPDFLSQHNVRYKERKVYETVFQEKKFERLFDGILFFSPSGVKSFFLANPDQKITAFCIGDTTAFEVKKYTDEVIISDKPTVENVLVKAIKHLKKYD